MSESNCAVMRIASLNKNVTVETSHFRNRKYADRAKGSCSNRKHFTMCNISAELVVSSALQTIEGDVSRLDIAFQSTLCYFFRKSSCHDHLVFHLTGNKFSGSSISAVESHESIFQSVVIFALNGLFIHILWNSVVDIQKCNCILAYNSSDKLT